MSIAVLIRRMGEAGATPEAIAIAVEAIEERDNVEAARKAKRAEQKRRERDCRATVARHDGDKGATVATKEVPPSPSAPPPMINNSTPPSPPASPSRKPAPDGAFAEFWRVWPNRVGRPAAERSFAKVAGELSAILDGVAAYVRDKPPDRPWLNPATFLNQRRWEDAPALPSSRSVVPFSNESRRNGTPKTPSDFLRDVIRQRADDDEGRDAELLG